MNSSPLRGLRKNPLLANAVALMSSSAGTAILGVIFWAAAAHLASTSTVGRMAAEIAALVLLANLAQLSFGPIFERFLPVAGERATSFILEAYVMCLVSALVFSSAYLFFGFGDSFLPSSLHWRALFVGAVVLWTIFILQDSALVGLRPARWIPVENILYAAAKLALLPLAIVVNARQGLFIAWMAPAILAIIGVATFMFRWQIPRHVALATRREPLPTRWRILALAGAQYTSMLINIVSTSIGTLIVISKLGAIGNAHYYIPAQVASGPVLLMGGIGRSLLVEAAHQPARLRHHFNVAIGALAVLVVPSVIVGYLLTPNLLGLFGHSYAVNGSELMRVLLLALPFNAITILYTAYVWLDQRVWLLVVREVISLALFLATLLLLIGHIGIMAVGYANLVSAVVQAVAELGPTIKHYRASTDADGGTA